MPTELAAVLVDTADPAGLGAWWAALLGRRAQPADDEGNVRVPPADGDPGVRLVFLHAPEAGAGNQQLHLDLRSRTPQEQRDLVSRAEAAGARRADIGQGDVPWVVLADPAGMLFCVLEPRPEYADAGPIAAVVGQSRDPSAAARFWAAATGWGVTASQPLFASVRAPGGRGTAIEFVAVRRLPAGKNRLHLDLHADHDSDAEVRRLRDLGARPLQVGQPADAPWTVLVDPDGAAFCVLGAGPSPS
jgi:hypothetical protein